MNTPWRNIITLERTAYTPYATLGQLTYLDTGFATLELPWKDNRPNVSCIPEGVWEVELYKSPVRGMVWQLKEVDNRTYIQLHIGNTPDDTEGCILLGKRGTATSDPPFIGASRAAFQHFMSLCNGERPDLIVVTSSWMCRHTYNADRSGR